MPCRTYSVGGWLINALVHEGLKVKHKFKINLAGLGSSYPVYGAGSQTTGHDFGRQPATAWLPAGRTEVLAYQRKIVKLARKSKTKKN